ncbi:biopolymer transporter ExbD [Spectribacter hydrogenoxidans]|uniref:Biopolymer transporter ExbD n=1 Tax=Spectribacter hydrogenoxidans TaxID=3075608 RepID=A0ABU3C079_9GAMM|nr:biopolymer transporter ExbD [Salinisphaera sp. W335]MDT0634967.1 biopolymer transporter ExbD [Salinisphaera sp. W335]
MRTSRRARRMERHHNRQNRRPTMNLVSLMDIFTILVFFLLVNASDVQTLPSPKDLDLPESSAEKQAEDTIVVMLTRDRILVNGREIIDHESAMAGDEATIPALAEALQRSALDDPEPAAEGEAPVGRGQITVMAHKELPYRLIRKVMLTGTAAEFGRVSLAVLQEPQG